MSVVFVEFSVCVFRWTWCYSGELKSCQRDLICEHTHERHQNVIIMIIIFFKPIIYDSSH